MMEFIFSMAVLVTFTLMSVRFGADSRDLQKSLNSMEPVRPQI